MQRVGKVRVAQTAGKLSCIMSCIVPGGKANRGGEGRAAEGEERTRAPKGPKGQAQRGGERSRDGDTSHIALHHARTDRGSRSRDKARTQGGRVGNPKDKCPANCFVPLRVPTEGTREGIFFLFFVFLFFLRAFIFFRNA